MPTIARVVHQKKNKEAASIGAASSVSLGMVISLLFNKTSDHFPAPAIHCTDRINSDR
jgi:hypothetical protein